ncbi:MAG: crosslink repair DNA glycosylase YcaQ family protein [Chloroflexota bacterium]
MVHLLSQTLADFRQITFRLSMTNRLRTRQQAVDYVNERGFIFFWPIQGSVLPSLWTATAGDRPVADAHDDPGHITWDWKDSLLGKKIWYYARILRRKNTFLSLYSLPYFYALSPNYGNPQQDYLEQYEAGYLTQEAKQVYEALLGEGALDTISLRKAARLSNPESDSRFNRALDTLQIEFKVLPVGTAKAGAWRYAFVYDLVHRHFPDLIEQSRLISEKQAYTHILTRYFESVGAASVRQIQAIFSWRNEDITRALEHLIDENIILSQVLVENQPCPVYALKDLVSRQS